MKSNGSVFLTAEWRYLVMLNYEIEPGLLGSLVPAGTELDQWEGKTFVSVVGFLFQDTRLGPFYVPFHRHFEEVNLRFYVRRRSSDGWRRAVVFIQELVPRWAIAWTARTFYNENYRALPMRHRILFEPDGSLSGASYAWKFKGRADRLDLLVEGQPALARPGSQEEFITEHYWGYARQRDGGTLEYQVEHPPWRVWPARSARLDCDVEALYGTAFTPCLTKPPTSAFLAEGSKVSVSKGRRIENLA